MLKAIYMAFLHTTMKLIQQSYKSTKKEHFLFQGELNGYINQENLFCISKRNNSFNKCKLQLSSNR